MIPNAVVGKHIMDEVSMLQAWREYLVLYSPTPAPADDAEWYYLIL
jgi:hypothetical protein